MKFLNFRYILLFLIVYVLALAAMFPIRWVLPSVSPMLASYGLSVSNLEGSLWQGNATVRHKMIDDIQLEWHSNPLHLLRLALPVDVAINNSHLDLSAKLAPSAFGIAVSNLSGYIDDQAIERYLKPYNIVLQGRLQFDNLSADSSWKLHLGDASGDLTFSGGPIAVPVGRSTQQYEVPTMLGTLTSNEQAWQLALAGTSAQEFIVASLEREGLGTLSVKRTLAEEMDIPLPQGGRSLFDVSQQVF
jgi:hypothetical protein